MQIREDEAEFLLLLGRLFEQNPYGQISEEEIIQQLGITADRLHAILQTFTGENIWQSLGSQKLGPLRRSLEVARDIERQREAAEHPDLVDRFRQWSRRRPVPAVLIVVVHYLGLLIGLVGGLMAILRGC